MFSNKSFKITAFLAAIALVNNSYAMECPTPKRQKVDTEEEKKQPTVLVKNLSSMCVDVLAQCTADDDKENNFNSNVIKAVAERVPNPSLIQELILKNRIKDIIPLEEKKISWLLSNNIEYLHYLNDIMGWPVSSFNHALND